MMPLSSSEIEMDREARSRKNSPSSSASSSDGFSQTPPPFPDEVLEKVLSFVDSHKDRNSVSLVRKDWYDAERWTRSKLFIGNCYSVSPEIVARRFAKIKSVTLKGRPRFSDFNMLPQDWGANVHPWLEMFAKAYPFLEELRLKRMTITDESLELLAKSFPSFKALTLSTCDGFSDNGLRHIATHCRNLTELDIRDCIADKICGGCWVSCFPENFASLEVLNFSSFDTEINFDALERLVSRCKSLRVLKVCENISMEQLQRLLECAPQLVELGTGSFQQELAPSQYEDIVRAFSNCKKIEVLSGLWQAPFINLSVIFGACGGLTFLNVSDVQIQSGELASLLLFCPNLRRLWILDSVGDKGLEAVGSSCPLLEELRVFPAGAHERQRGPNEVTELGFMAVSRGCRNLHYVLYFCWRMTNAAVVTVVQNCPNFTHFRLCIMNPGQPDYSTNQPMDEAFGAVVKTCHKLQRLSVSGLLTDLAFEYIGKYAKNLETLSVAFAGRSDRGMQFVLDGCPKLRKLEIRDCPFGNAALLFGQDKYEKMRSLWMSTCDVTMKGCKLLAKQMPRINIEIIKEDGNYDSQAETVYLYRSVAGTRRDAPPCVLTL